MTSKKRHTNATASPESIRLLLAITASKKWRLNSLDIKQVSLVAPFCRETSYIKKSVSKTF